MRKCLVKSRAPIHHEHVIIFCLCYWLIEATNAAEHYELALLMILHYLYKQMFSEEQSTNKSWAWWNIVYVIDWLKHQMPLNIMKGLLMISHSLNTRMFSEEQSTNISWACSNSLYMLLIYWSNKCRLTLWKDYT